MYVFNGYLFSQRPTGVMRYAREILQVIDGLCNKDEFVLLVPTYAKNMPPLQNIKTVKYGNRKGNLWEQVDFPRYLNRNDGEGVNFNNTMPILKPGIIVIHDVAYKTHPEFASSLHGKVSNLYHQIIFRIAARSDKPIVTVSYFSKQQLIDIYKIDPHRITVIGNAWQHFKRVEADNTILNKLDLRKKEYYFSLGSLSRMKNTEWIIEEAKKNPDKIFVLSGAQPQNSNMKFVSTNNVVFTGFISDEQVSALIQNCKAFIYSAIYDGFGIPPMEAMSLGAKILCSNAACLPEIYGSCVHYFDPYEHNINIDELLEESVADPAYVLEKYSWEKSGQMFYKLLKEN